MAPSAKWYGLAHSGQWGTGTPVNWTSDTINVSLHNATYETGWNQDTDQFWSTPVTNEITGTGYTTKGFTLTGKSINYAPATNEAQLLAGNASWATATFTAYCAVVFKNTGTNTTSPLLGFVDFGAAQSVSSGTFTIQWDATGVLKVVAA